MYTTIVLLLVVVALIAAVGFLVKQKKAGKHTCGGSCQGCVYSESCKSKDS